ncbi:hypothetical protein [Crocosphaera chwakensis]|uniref:Uncharacterized protein n=1 Tax=Crocosphaera chwakensis CCY0110 TaxID=391612 RepID=A3IXK4_9CHRO|nr:hypothetical protein [Crocosphaera chwakensis]EAZ88806.1 hypothetical protein CY0110_01095 [Crocosphaera chwakensis CCY0110]
MNLNAKSLISNALFGAGVLVCTAVLIKAGVFDGTVSQNTLVDIGTSIPSSGHGKTSNCVTVHSPVKTYKWVLENDTSFPLEYNLNGQWEYLEPGEKQYYSSRVGGGNSCGRYGYSFPELKLGNDTWTVGIDRSSYIILHIKDGELGLFYLKSNQSDRKSLDVSSN